MVSSSPAGRPAFGWPLARTPRRGGHSPRHGIRSETRTPGSTTTPQRARSPASTPRRSMSHPQGTGRWPPRFRAGHIEPSVSTPVATTTQGLKQICTRNPPDPMHYVSLDKALTNSRPTVVTFATPLLCTSKLCGPVVDEQLAAFTKIGGQRANFIHVEEFLPGPSLKPPPATAENTSPAFKAWKFQSEPWTIVIDKHGIIQGRFEGPFTAPQIEAAV